MAGSDAFSIGEFRVEPARNLVRHDGDEMRLEPKVMALLCALAERPDDVLTREELIDTIWGVKFGGDESLTRAVSILRKTIKVDEGAAGHIETVPKRGYRLTGDVEFDTAASAAPPVAPPAVTTAVADTQDAGATPAMAITEIGAGVEEPWRASPLEGDWRLFAGAVALIAVIVAVVVAMRPDPAPEIVGTPRIAVLPFENLSQDPQNDSFSRGVSEEILNALARIDGLEVVGRTSSFGISDSARDLQTISGLLDAETLLDGSVRVEGERVRISAQLIDMGDGSQIWSEVFDRELNDVFAIQEDIAEIVEDRLRVELGSATASAARPAAIRPDFEIYKLYLEGVSDHHERHVIRPGGSIDILEEVYAAAPDFLENRAYLSNNYSMAAMANISEGNLEVAAEFQAKSVDMARSVLAEDPENSKALSALGGIRWQGADFIAARRNYERALASSPSDDTAAVFYAVLLKSIGDAEAARDVLTTALQYNPTAPNLYRLLALVSEEIGDHERAFDYATLTAEYGYSMGIGVMSKMSLHVNDEATSRELFNAYESVDGDRIRFLEQALLDANYNPDLRDAYLQQILETNFTGPQTVLRGWGEDEKVDELMYRASEPGGSLDRNPISLAAVWLEGAEGYRSSDTFHALAERWNLPEYWRAHGFPPECRPLGDDDFECF